MRIKWLVILVVIFVAVILISLLITQQNNITALLSEPLSITEMPATLPLKKNRIAIIKAPPKETEYKTYPTQVENNTETTGSNSGKDSSSNTATQADAQAGTTKIGKYPPAKKSQEMNSSGIVMY